MIGKNSTQSLGESFRERLCETAVPQQLRQLMEDFFQVQHDKLVEMRRFSSTTGALEGSWVLGLCGSGCGHLGVALRAASLLHYDRTALFRKSPLALRQVASTRRRTKH